MITSLLAYTPSGVIKTIDFRRYTKEKPEHVSGVQAFPSIGSTGSLIIVLSRSVLVLLGSER